jgi:hypothetical protein
MGYILNISKLKLCIEAKKGGLIGMLRATNIPKGSYYKSLEIGWFTTERLALICDYLEIHPGELYSDNGKPAASYTHIKKSATAAAEPVNQYSVPGIDLKIEILETVRRIERKIDDQQKHKQYNTTI